MTNEQQDHLRQLIANPHLRTALSIYNKVSKATQPAGFYALSSLLKLEAGALNQALDHLANGPIPIIRLHEERERKFAYIVISIASILIGLIAAHFLGESLTEKMIFGFSFTLGAWVVSYPLLALTFPLKTVVERTEDFFKGLGLLAVYRNSQFDPRHWINLCKVIELIKGLHPLHIEVDGRSVKVHLNEGGVFLAGKYVPSDPFLTLEHEAYLDLCEIQELRDGLAKNDMLPRKTALPSTPVGPS